MFKIDSEKILNAPINKIGNGWDSEKFKDFLYTIFDKDDKFDNYHFEAEFSEIGLQHITLSAKRIYLPQNNKKYVLITFLI
jgi:hypothetical protein